LGRIARRGPLWFAVVGVWLVVVGIAALVALIVWVLAHK
jgi:hypothetical protein